MVSWKQFKKFSFRCCLWWLMTLGPWSFSNEVILNNLFFINSPYWKFRRWKRHRKRYRKRYRKRCCKWYRKRRWILGPYPISLTTFFYILIMDEKVLVSCEKWLEIFIKSLRFETPWVRKNGFYENDCLSVRSRSCAA